MPRAIGREWMRVTVAAIPAVIGLEINRFQGETVREAVALSAALGQAVAVQLAPAAPEVLPVLAGAAVPAVAVRAAVAVVDAGKHFSKGQSHQHSYLREM